MLRIYQQGNLDGLYGIYAIVNAVNHLFGERVDEWYDRELFKFLVEALPRRSYPDVLWNGIGPGLLFQLAKKTAEYYEADATIEVKRPFVRRQFAHRIQFFEAVADLGSKQPSDFIVWVDWEGGGAHWTLLRDVTRERIRLVDSSGTRTIQMKGLGVSGERGTRIRPRNTIMLTLTEPGR